MSYLAIMKVGEDNRVLKFQDCATKVAADQHVEKWLLKFPKAYAVENPDRFYDFICMVFYRLKLLGNTIF